MDKRLIKTRNAIYEAFAKVLNEKPYSKITIEDILAQSKTSRSTFYAHYKTKDELLNSLINHIFEHVFSHTLTEESTHDFSKSSIFEYSHLITHILYHLHDEKSLIKAILSSESKDIFEANIKTHLEPLCSLVVNNNLVPKKDIPLELHKQIIANTFILSMEYWFNGDCKETPEVMTNYFFSMNK